MKKKSVFTIALLIILALGVILFTTACGSGYVGDYYNGGMGSGDKNDSIDPSSGDGAIVGDINRKIIYTVYLSVSCDDLDALGTQVRTETASFGGYVESSREYNGGDYVTNEYVLRIPTAELDEFLKAIEDGRDINSKTVTTRDITTQYVSANAKKEALTTELNSLLSLLESADKIDDIIALSDRIAGINAELGSIEKILNEYDSLVEFSTVTISATKAVEHKDNRNFGQKLRDLIVASFKSIGTVFKGILIGITAAFPYMLLLAAVGALAGTVIIIVNKKRKGKASPKIESEKETTTEEKSDGGEN